MKKSWIAILGMAIAASAGAQVSFTGSYTQDFNTLLTSGTNNPWTDNSTLAGWYMRRMDDVNGELTDVYTAGNGSSTTGAVYAFGTGTDPDRALGSIGSGSVEHAAYGVRLTNNTGSALNSVNLLFTGEQWRDGGNASLATQSLQFSYNIGGSTIGADLQTAGGVAGYTLDPNFTRVASFDFTSPVATATAAALDGNAAANRTTISGVLNLSTPWANGTDLWIRWVDLNDVGNDHGLAIDDFRVTSSPVPEPASMTVLALGGLALLRRRRNAR